jgi:DNA replication initiation complex subunit (GINS family)
MFEENLKSVLEMEEKARKARAELEKSRMAELKALPKRFGYENLEAFIKDLKVAAGKRTTKGATAAKDSKEAKPAKTGKRRHTRVTPEKRELILADLRAGKVGSAIAKHYDISYSTLSNIKRAAGLVQRGSAKASTPAPAEAPNQAPL